MAGSWRPNGRRYICTPILLQSAGPPKLLRRLALAWAIMALNDARRQPTRELVGLARLESARAPLHRPDPPGGHDAAPAGRGVLARARARRLLRFRRRPTW